MGVEFPLFEYALPFSLLRNRILVAWPLLLLLYRFVAALPSSLFRYCLLYALHFSEERNLA